MSTTAQAQPDQQHRQIPLQCMEIWGGNEPVENAISVPGIDALVYAIPHSGSDHGGDLHYVSLCGAGNISRFVVADVSGHGESVHDKAVLLRKLMRKHITTADQSRFIRRLNAEYGEQNDASFATAVLMTYFAPTDHLIVTNAGHPMPFWYRASTQSWSRLEPDAVRDAVVSESRAVGINNLPLGVIEGTRYEQFAVKLDRDDLIVVYTDSLIEAPDGAGSQLGEQGLLDLLGTMDLSQTPSLPRRIARAVGDRAGQPLDDDVTVMVLHHNAADPPRQSLTDKVRVMGRMLGLGS